MTDSPIHQLAVRCPACKAVIGIDSLAVVSEGRPTPSTGPGAGPPLTPGPLPPPPDLDPGGRHE